MYILAIYLSLNIFKKVNLYLDPIDCRDCNLAWLIRDNPKLIDYVFHGVCSNGTAFSNLNSKGYSHCPLSPINPCNASPCNCTSSTINSAGLALNCVNAGLDDTQMSDILNYFLSPGVGPLMEIDAGYNSLTKIPIQLSQFQSIESIDLRNNKITSISSGTFNYKSIKSIFIILFGNQITSISPGIFNFPSATSIFIDINSNLISKFPSGVFNFPSASVVNI